MGQRINRATYWLWLAVIAVLYVGMSAVAHKVTAVSEGVLLFICIPRLHDVGRSGWWAGGALLAEIIAVILTTAAAISLSWDMQLTRAVIGLVVLAIFCLVAVLGFLPGQPAANRFGEPPAPGIALKRKPKPVDAPPSSPATPPAPNP